MWETGTTRLTPATLQDSWEQASQLMELFGLLFSPVIHETSTIIQEPQHWPCATGDPEETGEQGAEGRGVHLTRPSQNAVLVTSSPCPQASNGHGSPVSNPEEDPKPPEHQRLRLKPCASFRRVPASPSASLLDFPQIQ